MIRGIFMVTAIIILIIIFAIFGSSDNKTNSGKYANVSKGKSKRYDQPALSKKEIKQIQKSIRRQQEEAELDMFATIEAFMDD